MNSRRYIADRPVIVIVKGTKDVRRVLDVYRDKTGLHYVTIDGGTLTTFTSGEVTAHPVPKSKESECYL